MCSESRSDRIQMDIQDFKEHESGLTQSKGSKETSPFLDTITAVRFEEGSFALNYKTSHFDQESSVAVRHLSQEKRRHNTEMKSSRVRFFVELLSKKDIPDMMDQY